MAVCMAKSYDGTKMRILNVGISLWYLDTNLQIIFCVLMNSNHSMQQLNSVPAKRYRATKIDFLIEKMLCTVHLFAYQTLAALSLE